VSVPVHCVEHQLVDALPSTASPAGCPLCSVVAVALPVKATLSASPGPCRYAPSALCAVTGVRGVSLSGAAGA
jgi:hypothetical protein